MNLIKRFFLDDKNILGLILINALVIFAQGYKELDEHPWLALADNIISVIFILEMLVKASHFGIKEYLRPSWNKFDVLLILLSIPSLVVYFTEIEGIPGLSFLLAFRVFRVFKFFRFIKFFPQVEHIMRSAQQAMKSSFMVLMGFFVFIFIMGIMSCYFYRDIDPQGFGDPLTAYYTTFKVFTVEGWNSVPEETISRGELQPLAAFFTKIYFIGLFIIGGIFGLSIVNSIFVDAMVSDNDDEEFQRLEQKIDQLHEQIAQLNDALMHQRKNDKN